MHPWEGRRWVKTMKSSMGTWCFCRSSRFFHSNGRMEALLSRQCAENDSCLKRMAGELQEGEWAIWGALAKGKLEEKNPQKSDVSAYAALIRRFTNLHASSEGKRLHSELRCIGMDQHRYLGNLLVQMYGSCKCLVDAKAMFEKMGERNLYSWNIMMGAYIQNGHLREARELFDRLPVPNVVSWNAMHAAYAQVGDLVEARKLFDQMPERDPVSWNTMIVLHAQKGQMQESRSTFDEMPQRNVVSWNSIIVAYVWLGRLQQARRMFDGMPFHNVVSWNTVISAYVQNGHLHEARGLFEEMPERDVVSWTALVTAYAQNRELERASYMFDKMPLKDVVSWTAMITAYAQNGHLQEARSLLDGLGTYDVGSWNAMITGYVQNGQARKALEIFRLMDLEGVPVDKVTFFNVLEASISLANLAEGKAIHAIAKDSGFLLNLQVGNSLINMYGKCGSLEDGRSVFDKMPQRDVVSWNAMITAYAKNGECRNALEIFHLMVLEGEQPDEIAFLSTLSGCSHGGLLRDGWQCFTSIERDHGVVPNVDHYVCMVDLLGRAGQLGRAEELLTNMPFEPHRVAWRTLLAACRVHGDTERGARLAKLVMELDRVTSASYVLLSNIYSAAGNPSRDGDGAGEVAMNE